MSFDLAFYTTDPAGLSKERIAQEVAAVLGKAATPGTTPGGTPMWSYKSEETGVTFRLEYTDPAASNFAPGVIAGGGGAKFSGLAVNVNYVRPRFVGIEVGEVPRRRPAPGRVARPWSAGHPGH